MMSNNWMMSVWVIYLFIFCFVFVHFCQDRKLRITNVNCFLYVYLSLMFKDYKHFTSTCKQDLAVRDRYETETFKNMSRDRLEAETSRRRVHPWILVYIRLFDWAGWRMWPPLKTLYTDSPILSFNTCCVHFGNNKQTIKPCIIIIIIRQLVTHIQVKIEFVSIMIVPYRSGISRESTLIPTSAAV